MSREAGRALALLLSRSRVRWQAKSWMSPVRLVVELRLRNDDYDC